MSVGARLSLLVLLILALLVVFALGRAVVMCSSPVGCW